MFAWLIAWSLAHPRLVLLGAGAILVAAGWAVPRMAVDVFPELNAPTVVVMTEAGGLAAAEVEQQVSIPIESAVAGVPGLRRVRSASALGLSFVWAEFAWGEDLWRARQQVAERLDALRERLPPGAHAEISPVTSLTGEIMLLAIAATGAAPAGAPALRTFAEAIAAPRLLAVPGIVQVTVIGGELPEYQVLCRQERLAVYGLTTAQVADAARGAHATGGAGVLPDVAGRTAVVPVGPRWRCASRRRCAAWAIWPRPWSPGMKAGR